MPRKTSKVDFTLEKLGIKDQLTDIGTDLKAHIQRFEHHCEKDELVQEQVMEIVKDHQKTIHGNNGTPGLKTDVDRLNQKERLRSLMYIGIWTTLCGLVTTAVWTILTRIK
jgi:hypothetical protein